MNIVKLSKWFLVLVVVSLFLSIWPAKAEKLSFEEQRAVINKVGDLLKGNYIYADKTKGYIDYLEKRLEQGAYKKLKGKQEFSKQLTNDLFEVSRDLHFSVGFNPQLSEFLSNTEGESKEQDLREQDRKESQANNHKFIAVEILEGNVGYLRFDYFADPEFANGVVTASMKFLNNTDALIIDLRNNNGGHMELSQLLMSYFLKYEDDKALYDYYYNDDGKRVTRKMWLLPSVYGEKYLDKPIYILTSSFTFSAAEWMAYVLQNRKRAIIVGEATPGGAHPVGAKVIDSDFVINIPIGEVKDPLTQSDFEGEGIEPDIKAYFSQALPKAHKDALKKLKGKFSKNATSYDWHIEKLKALENPIQLSDEKLSQYQGTFGARKIWKEGKHLYYNWNNKGRFKLVPMSETKFMFEGLDDFRFEMVLENGQLAKLKRIDKDGSTREYQRADW